MDGNGLDGNEWEWIGWEWIGWEDRWMNGGGNGMGIK